MQNQPEQKGLSVAKSALIGTAVAVPIALGAFYLGYSNDQTSVIAQPSNQAQTSNQTQPSNAQADTKDLRIKGNKNSRIFHLPGCASYNQIKDKNVIWFKTIEEAEAAGFRMAKNC